MFSFAWRLSLGNVTHVPPPGGQGRRVGGRPPGGAAVPREPERRGSILSAVDVTVSGEARRVLFGDVVKGKQHLPVFESLSSGGGAPWCSTTAYGSSIASTSDGESASFRCLSLFW